MSILTDVFRHDGYLRINSRRLEHLATLDLPLTNKSVLEVGAGIGDHSSFYIDRGCKITITEGRADNVEYIKTTYPHEDVRILDVDNPNLRDDEKWNIIHCYGLLYHLKCPAKAICFISKHCTDFAILETIAHSKEYKIPLLYKEPKEIQQNSLCGDCYRFSKDWLIDRLKENFKYIYITKILPFHNDFPSKRGVFIASHIELTNNNLSLG